MRSLISYVALVALVPLSFATPHGSSPDRPAHNGKTCTVRAHGKKRDDTPQILKAFKECNNGGTVVFPEKENYWIATKLNPVIYDVTIDWKGLWMVWDTRD